MHRYFSTRTRLVAPPGALTGPAPPPDTTRARASLPAPAPAPLALALPRARPPLPPPAPGGPRARNRRPSGRRKRPDQPPPAPHTPPRPLPRPRRPPAPRPPGPGWPPAEEALHPPGPASHFPALRGTRTKGRQKRKPRVGLPEGSRPPGTRPRLSRGSPTERDPSSWASAPKREGKLHLRSETLFRDQSAD